MVERPRDEAGRARNPRPRDRLGRPLPIGSVGVPRIPDDLNLPPQQTLTFAQQLFDDGLAFNAHEVLEAAWKNGPFAEKMLWQGLAQYAVGITHLQRGNPKGARTLLTRAIGRLEAQLRGDSSPTAAFPYDIDGSGIIAHARRLLGALDRGEPITEADLATRLTPDSPGTNTAPAAGDEGRASRAPEPGGQPPLR
ncbi:DUF309 domain-containing protein [Nocardia higoensis]|uniref:DUF309 domain-containing protein n=1 Tax=Nocardia higoensis TaxID=228599 RepID=A0ABS0DHI4_9NOCA|nr:DUF309 domain-containing protein [Nocardia higoensis]